MVVSFRVDVHVAIPQQLTTLVPSQPSCGAVMIFRAVCGQFPLKFPTEVCRFQTTESSQQPSSLRNHRSFLSTTESSRAASKGAGFHIVHNQ